jgi:hypothetical protein
MIRQLRFKRVAEVRQASLRSNLGHIRDRISPSRQLMPRNQSIQWDRISIPLSEYVPSWEAAID